MGLSVWVLYWLWLSFMHYPGEYMYTLARIDACEKFIDVDQQKLQRLKEEYDLANRNSSMATVELLRYQLAEDIGFASEGGERSLKAECWHQVWNSRRMLGFANPLSMK
jgi:hypothetical protein